jgi:hypothetical protein
MAVSSADFGLVYGLARGTGCSPFEAVFASVVTVADASQFGALGAIAAGMPWAGILLVTAWYALPLVGSANWNHAAVRDRRQQWEDGAIRLSSGAKRSIWSLRGGTSPTSRATSASARRRSTSGGARSRSTAP